MGGVFDAPDEGPAEIERPRQRPMEVDRSKYYETGNLQVAAGSDGLPVVAGGAPQGADDGLTDDNLVCIEGEGEDGRPACEHYVAILLPADGVARGYGEMRQIRRFCKRLSTASELFEIDQNIYACTSRSPQDAASRAQILVFEAKQKQLARDSAETTGELDF
jgi:hypothetical protein